MRQALSAPDDQGAEQPQQPSNDVASIADADAGGLMGVSDSRELGNAVVGAGRDALQGMVDTIRQIDPTQVSDADLRTLGVDPNSVGKLPEVPRAEGPGAEAVNAGRDVGKFILGFLGGSAAFRSMGMAEGALKNIAASGLGDFFVSSAHDPMLSDFLSEFPEIKGTFLEALANAGKSDDFSWARKIEAAGEGALAAATIEAIVKVAGVFRKVISAQRSGDPKAVQKAINEAEPELQQAYDETQKAPTPKVAEVPPETPPAAATLKTNGDTFEHAINGDTPLPLSNSAKAELKAATTDGATVKFEDLTPATQAEVKAWLEKNPDAVPKAEPKYEPTFKLDNTNRADFDAALERTLSVPYATLRAEAPGTALEDVLGNYLNFSKYSGPDEAKVILSDLADAMQPKIDALGGGAVRDWKLVNSEVSEMVGGNPAVVAGSLKQLAGMTNMDTIVTASRVLLNSMTNDLLKIARRVSSGLATEEDKLRLLQTKDALGDFVGLMKNAQRNVARSQAAMRQAVGEAAPEMEKLALRQELDDETYKFVSSLLGMTDGSPKAVVKLLEPTFGQKAWGVLHEFWVNSVLSRVTTQVVNITGNARNTFLFPMYRVVGGALTGNRQAIDVGLAQYATLKNHIFDSAEMARRAFVSNAPILDTKATQIEAKRGFINAGTFGLDDNGIFGIGVNWLGKAINVPSRFLTTTDEFFGQLNYRASVEAHARIEAAQKGLSNEPTIEVMVNGEKQMVSPAEKYVSERMDEAFNPTTLSGYNVEDGTLLNSTAMADSRRSKFTSPIKPDATWMGARSIGEIAHGAAASVPLVQHFILPFTRVPVNIFREMVNESPLAPIRAQFWHDMSKGGEAAADAAGRLALGSVFSIGIGMLAAEGFVTGQGPSDPQLNKQWREANNQPYSFRLPGMGEDGRDLFISYNRLDPMAGIVGVIADAMYISAHVDKRTQNKIATTLALSVAQNLNSKGYLQSLTDLMAVLKGSRNGASGAVAAERWLNNRMASYVPSILSLGNSDNTIRETRDWLDAVMKKIPGLSQGLDPQFDNLGEPMVMAQSWPWREVNPFTIAEGKSGPARSEMNEWGEGPTATRFLMPHPSIGGVLDLRDYKNPITGTNAYRRWMELVSSPIYDGKTTEQSLNEFVKSDAYKEMKKTGKIDPIYRDHPAADAIKKQLELHYQIAYQTMLNERGFEDLRDALQSFKVNSKVVPRGGEAMPGNPTLQDLLKEKR